MIKFEEVQGQKSWVVESNKVKMCISEAGGHMAPVTFMKDSPNPVQPFYVSPWSVTNQKHDEIPDLLKSLRGDFFCLPFGRNDPWRDENHPPHGETANCQWRLEDSKEENVITLYLDTRARKGCVRKNIYLPDDENNLYISHSIKGFSGPTTFGHHVMFPADATKYIDTSPIHCGFTNKNTLSGFQGTQYSSLADYRKFDSIKKVPTIWADEPYSDCSVIPSREGFDDIIQLFSKTGSRFAWTTITVPDENYLWFALRDTDVQPSTVIWMSNKGRYKFPWLGRNCCIGIEDMCGHLVDGLKDSVQTNGMNDCGFKTFVEIDNGLIVNYIQGVVTIPKSFDRVARIEPVSNGIDIISRSGQKVFTKVDYNFLENSSLKL